MARGVSLRRRRCSGGQADCRRAAEVGRQGMARLSRMVRDKTPQFKFEYALWTLALIRELIARQFGVKLSRSRWAA